MRRFIIPILAVLAVSACDDDIVSPRMPEGQAMRSAIVSNTNIQIPFASTVLVTCANGGAGEFVDITGTLHVVQHSTVADNGSHGGFAHSQLQWAKGVGQSTGDVYQASGVTQIAEFDPLGPQMTTTTADNVLLIGPGPGNNRRAHMTIHLTVNANGEVSADVNIVEVTCS
jgi:hypothetical protein